MIGQIVVNTHLTNYLEGKGGSYNFNSYAHLVVFPFTGQNKESSGKLIKKNAWVTSRTETIVHKPYLKVITTEQKTYD